MEKRGKSDGRPSAEGAGEAGESSAQGNKQTPLDLETEALRESQQHLEAVLDHYVDLYDSCPVGYLTLDPSGRVLEMNSTAANLLAIERSHTAGVPSSSLVARESLKVLLGHLRRCRSSEGTVTSELEMKGRRDAPFRVQLVSIPVMHEGKRLYRTAMLDLGRRLEMERELRKGKELAESIVDCLDQACAVLDGSLAVVQANPAFCKMVPAELDLLLGQPAERILQLEASSARFRDQVEAVLRSGTPMRDLVVELPSSDKAKRWLVLSAKLLPGQSEERRLILLSVEDATERMADLVRTDQKGIRELIAHAPVGVHWAAADGTILWANQTELEAFGYSAEEYVGHSLREFYVEPAAIDWVFERLRSQETVANLEAQVRCRDGSIKEVLLSANGLWRAGRFIHSNCFTREITDRKRVEAQIRKLNEELEQRVRNRTLALEQTTCELEAFSYTIAHDLRSPLRAMEGFAHALLEDYSPSMDEQGRDYLHRIVEAARREDKLIEDLLDYSQLKLAPVALSEVSLDQAFDAVLARLADEAQRLKASIRVDRPLAKVLAHPTTVEQILFHLLCNALKFTTPHLRPRIRIWAEDHEESTRLWIRDNGIGIAPEHQQRIFNVFERLHGQETYPGTGIGLAMVRKGMDRLKGRVGVESELGKGSRFWVEFPKAPPPSA